jgi:hypothetical protein
MVTARAPRTRAARAQEPSAEEIYMQDHENVVESVISRGIGSDGEAQKFTHITAKLVVMYFPTSWGWESREVPSTNMRMVRDAGARVNCGDCKGNCSPDPMNPQYNNCPGREKFATRQCPECGRLIYDFGARSVNADLLDPNNAERMADADGTLIDDGAYRLATPAARTKVLLDRHLSRYHETAAQALGLPPDADRGAAGNAGRIQQAAAAAGVPA